MHPSIEASLDEWLAYVESIHPTEIELGLDRLKTVSDRLLPGSKSSFVFTVAGTNGKGTTTAALSALSLAAGKSVGWYSSPHLRHFNERIRINNEPVENDVIVRALFAVEVARQGVSLSYFEFTTLAAFWVFLQAELDVWVLEVGLGGRLDAVNIIDADIAVITNIGLDHQSFLGDTREQIGYEKAGIARPSKPVVLGSEDIPNTVMEHIALVGAQAFPFGKQHGVTEIGQVFFQGGSIPVAGIHLPAANVSAALQAFALSPFEINSIVAQKTLESIQVEGRLQRFEYKGRKVVVDVGHNPHAAQYIARQLAGEQYHLIIGMLADKDAAGFIKALSPITAAISYISLHVARGTSAEQLHNATQKPGACFADLDSAIESAISAEQDYPLFIGGSFYTVCDALDLLEN